MDPLFWISELRTLIDNQWYQELISHKFIVTILEEKFKKKLIQIRYKHLQKLFIAKCQVYQK